MIGFFRGRETNRPANKRGRQRRARTLSLLERLEDRTLMAGSVLYRINAGGPSLEGSPAWAADTSDAVSIYTNASAARSLTSSTTNAVDLSSPSLPAGTPMALFQTGRWDQVTAAEMQWS